MSFRIERTQQQEITLFSLIGRIEAGHIAELQELFHADHRNVLVDLKEVRLVDREVVRFLTRCEAEGIKLQNCPGYVREWMDREKLGKTLK